MESDTQGRHGATALTRRAVCAGGLAVAGLALGGMPARAALPAPAEVRYRVLRDGLHVGRHVLRLSESGGLLVAHNDIEITVRLLGIPIYRYAHVSTERWDGDRLVALDSRTEKNGKEKWLNGERRGERLVLGNQDGERRSFADSPLTTALWHPRTPYQRQLLEIEDGWMKQVDSRDLGETRVAVAGQDTPARRFHLGGEIGSDVWYDTYGRLLQVAFASDKDGSQLVVEAEDVRSAD